MRAIWVLLAASLALPAESTQIEQRIAASRLAIEKNKSDANAYDALALALVRRARETANASFCTEAEALVAESLKLAPGGFEGRRARVAVWLCEKRWADALEEATAVHKLMMDDVVTWGYIADAQIALGDYESAGTAVQWMINMRQASSQGLQRGAQLREVYGMTGPSMEWWMSALHLTSAEDLEERAWLLTHIAQLDRTIGKYDAGEDFAKQALTLIPDYPWALDELGRNLAANRKFPEAVTAFQKRQAIAPSISGLYELALAFAQAGDSSNSKHTFLDFETKALAVAKQPDNANLELVKYYAGEGNKPGEGVRIARQLLTRRHDLATLAACAQGLAAQGDWKAAAAEMAQALKTGVKNPEWLMEAGRIARKTGDENGARKYFQQALEAAPSSPISEQVIRELTTPPA